MPTAKEVKAQIRSIQSTQKITHAMEMVAASKMRKAQDRMRASRPYFYRIKDVIGHLVQGNLEYTHPYLIERPVKNVGFVIISTDRGLCGGLNINLFKRVLEELIRFDAQGVVPQVITVGRKAEIFWAKHNVNIIASVTGLGDFPKIRDFLGIIKVMSDAFISGEMDEIYVAYNTFTSTLVQKPSVELLFPIKNTMPVNNTIRWDYIYEPSADVLLDTLLNRYVESIVYQSAVENVACEQAARMVAMKNATDNAGELIEDLKLVYNKARQAAITKELAEIVAGAAAV
jgi:F-type H+-transporting ATPase subunit gamma